VVTDDGTPNMGDMVSFVVTVNEVNEAPVLDSIGDRSVDEGSELSFTVPATDADLPANNLTFSLDAAALANGMLISPSGQFSWTPTEAQGPGVFAATITVSDDGNPVLSDSETINITVNEVNEAPVLDAIGNQVVDELTELSFTAAASDADIPENNLIFNLSGAPAGASIDPVSGLFSWIPAEDQDGVHSFDVLVTDDGAGNLFDSEAIEVTVNEVNLAPAITSVASIDVDENQAAVTDVQSTDPDGQVEGAGLTYSLTGGADQALFAIDPDTGVMTFQAAPDFENPADADENNVYEVSVTVTDATTLSDSQALLITVADVNEAPVAGADAYTTGQNTVLLVSPGNGVLGNDGDEDGDVLSAVVDAGPTNGTLELNADGSFVYTPNTDYIGADSFSYFANDGSVNSDPAATVSITVQAAGTVSPGAGSVSLDTGGQADDATPDTFRVFIDGDNTTVTLNGVLLYSQPTSGITDFSFLGSGDNDTLVIDFGGGNPIPAGGLTYNGENPTSGDDNDVLSVVNGMSVDAIYTTAGSSSGSINFDGRLITYTGLEPIIDDILVEHREFVFSDGDDEITVDVGTERSFVDSPDSESVDFINPTQSVTIASGDGDDTITIGGSVDPGYQLNLKAGNGSDTVVSSLPVNALLTGTQERDHIRVEQDGDTLFLRVNGEQSRITGASSLTIDTLDGKDFIVLSSVTMDVNIDAGPGKDIIRTSGMTGSVVVNGGDDKDLLIRRADDDVQDVDVEKVMITKAALASADSLKWISGKLKSLAKHFDVKHDGHLYDHDRHGKGRHEGGEKASSLHNDKSRHGWSNDHNDWTFGKNEKNGKDGDTHSKRHSKVMVDWDDDALARSSLKSVHGGKHVVDFDKDAFKPVQKKRGR
jgi:hypothetical protein